MRCLSDFMSHRPISQLRVINCTRAASELGPLIPGQRTCSDYFSMSVSCHQRTLGPFNRDFLSCPVNGHRQSVGPLPKNSNNYRVPTA